MSRKKTLEEQKSLLMHRGNFWLEPFRKWVLEAKTLGETVVSGSKTEKKERALKIYGSNLLLDCKKASGEAVKPWSLLAENKLFSQMVPVCNQSRIKSSQAQAFLKQVKAYFQGQEP